MPKVLFGNFVNQVMTGVPAGPHVRALTAPSARKIWYAEVGDMLILPMAPERAFLQYACTTLNLIQNDVDIIVPKGPLDEYLAVRLQNDVEAYSKLLAFREGNPDATAHLFAQDSVSADFLRSVDLRLHPYSTLPTRAALAVASRLNTKSGFKDLAAGLSIQAVPGELATFQQGLADTARKLLAEHAAVVIKIDRGSNGYGHTIVRRGDDLGTLDSRLNRFYEQPDRYIVEPLLSFTDLPSVEFQITDAGPEFSYICNMRCVNNAWTGMITPASGMSPEITATLLRWGRSMAEFLFDAGYRGTFDIDCGLTAEGALFATESNCRNTGGTYLYFLLKRLFGEAYDSITWLADSRGIQNSLSFQAGLDALERAGLAWVPGCQSGVILTSNTREIDQKWRYVIVGSSDREVQSIEERLLAVLGDQ